MAKSNVALLPGSSRNLTNAIPLDVSIVNGSGDQVTNFGGSGGTSSDFDATFPTSGTAQGYKDPSGFMKPGLTDGAGNIKVNVVAGGAAGQAATTPVNSVILADATSHTAFPADATRLGASLCNRSAVPFLVYAGTTASATHISSQIQPGERVTLVQLFGVLFTGRIDVISEGSDPTTNAGLYISDLFA